MNGQICGNCGRYMVEVDSDLFECQHCGDITDVRYLGMDDPFGGDPPMLSDMNGEGIAIWWTELGDQ